MTVFFSEIRFENPEDFVEIVATSGEDLTSYSIAVYNSTGDLQYTHSVGGEYLLTYAGNDGYLIDMVDGLPDMGQDWGVALIDSGGGVVQFVSGEGNVMTANDGPAAGATSITGPTTSGGESIESNDFGASYSVQTAPNPGTIPCFAPGTMIDTPDGPRPVETLQPGDLVTTLDNGPQEILWTRQGTQPLDGVSRDGRPVLISMDAFRPGCPTRDLVLSPQHRILVGEYDQLPGHFDTPSLAPAKAFTRFPGIRAMMGRKQITWFHFACRKHQVVFANGCATESLLIGPMVISSLSRHQQRVLTDIFGVAEQSTALNGPPSRPCLSVQNTRRLLAESMSNKAAAENLTED